MSDYKLEEVSIEITNECVLNCKHCSSMSGEKMANELSLIEITDIVSQSKRLGVSVISLSGGDPILSHNKRYIMYDIIEHDMEVLLYTTGITGCSYTHGISSIGRSDMESFMDIFRHNKGAIIFSIEGSRKTHDFITGVEGSFNATIRSITFAKDLGINTQIHFTLMKQNINDIDNFLKIAEMLEVNKVSFLRLVRQGRAEINDCMITPYEFMLLQEKLYSYNGNVKMRVGCPLSFGHLLGYEEYRPMCHAGKDVLLVRPDGDVHACAGWKNCKEMSLGNVREQTLQDIWENSKVLNMVRDYNSNLSNVKGFCTDCPQKQFCGGGCPAQRIIFNQNNGINKLPDKIYIGCDPICLRFNGLLSDDVINHNRKKNGFKIHQDNEGNIVR